jgi:WhiB family redox-sensing transcriptional regulator
MLDFSYDGDSSWEADAACHQPGQDPELWFPVGRSDSEGYKLQAETARYRCSLCPVLAQCLTKTLTLLPEYGIWAGTTEDYRAAIRRRQRQAARERRRETEAAQAALVSVDA